MPRTLLFYFVSWSPFTIPLLFCLLKRTSLLVLLPQSRTGARCHSCCPLSFRLHGSTTINLQETLVLWNPYITTAFLTASFYWPPRDSVSTSTPGLNVISSHGILPTLSAQWVTSSWDTLVITQNWSFKISNSETGLPAHNVLLTSWAPRLLWNLLLCPCHDSWFLTPLYYPQVWETPLPRWPHYPVKNPMVNHLNSPFTSTLTLVSNPGHSLFPPIQWLHIAQGCHIVVCIAGTIDVCTLSSAGFSVLFSNTVPFLIDFTIACDLPETCFWLFNFQRVTSTFLSLRKFRPSNMNSLLLSYYIKWSHPNYPFFSFSFFKRKELSLFFLLNLTT